MLNLRASPDLHNLRLITEVACGPNFGFNFASLCKGHFDFDLAEVMKVND